MPFTRFVRLLSLFPMKILTGYFFLLFVLLDSVGVCQSAATGGRTPENDYNVIRSQITKSTKDTSAIRAWFEENLSPASNAELMLSQDCLAFVSDVSECFWGYDGCISAEELSRKWAKRFDVRNPWDHAFENGNCGWASRKLVKCEYLGDLNGGDWFRIAIKGGCGENDYSESLTRVVKVESKGGRYQITNFMNPDGE